MIEIGFIYSKNIKNFSVFISQHKKICFRRYPELIIFSKIIIDKDISTIYTISAEINLQNKNENNYKNNYFRLKLAERFF